MKNSLDLVRQSAYQARLNHANHQNCPKSDIALRIQTMETDDKDFGIDVKNNLESTNGGSKMSSAPNDKVDRLDNQANEIVERERGKKLIARLLFSNSKLARRTMEHEDTLAKIEFDFREKAFTMARDVHLQTIQETFNDFLVRGKTNIRAERQQFFNEKMTALRREKQNTVEKFLEDVEKAWSKLDSITIEKLKQKEQQRIELMVDRFYSTFDSMEDEFMKILEENVKA